VEDNFSTAELIFYVTVNLYLSLVSGVLPHFFFRTTLLPLAYLKGPRGPCLPEFDPPTSSRRGHLGPLEYKKERGAAMRPFAKLL